MDHITVDPNFAQIAINGGETIGQASGVSDENVVNMSEVENAGLARRRIIFHYLRLCAALKAFHRDTSARRQQWWMQNLKFELVFILNDSLAPTHNTLQTNALTFVGLCASQGWDVSVPNLIRLLGRLLSGETECSALSTTNDIWKELYATDDLSHSFMDRTHLAWWVCPGSREAFFTFDEIDEAFEQYLLQVCHRINFWIKDFMQLAVGSKYGRD